jgi:superoxide dismutase, Fe-Mn family
MDAHNLISKSARQFAPPETILVRPLLLKPQWMNGLSERMLISHYEHNYGGAVRRLNVIRARLAALDWALTPAFEINGLKREELMAASSVMLHEIYFESLGGHGDNPPTGNFLPTSQRRLSVISAASQPGAPSLPRWPRRWAAARAG